MHTRRALLLAAVTTAALASARSAPAAQGPYVVVRDDGSLTKPVTDPDIARRSIWKQYAASGAARPDVLSVWTSFPMGGNVYETLFDPVANDVTGIGLDQEYGGDGTFPSDTPPLRAMLLHNDVLALAERAKLQHAPLDGFAEYLFLLELSHAWGPAVRVPGADGGGAASTELEGFPFHWSFWCDMGGSPAGGNPWKDDGDGTFTVQGQEPGTMTYSMLDLYLMGLADASEVPPFGVLENAVPPTGVPDPFTGQPYAASSFPWFGDTPFTVTATRRTLTIADVVAANGRRAPAYGTSPTTFDLGIVLVVPANATSGEVAAAEAVFDPVSATLAPAFARATRGRGSMRVVTSLPPPDAGGEGGGDDAADEAGDDAGADGSDGVPQAGGGNEDRGGCTVGAGAGAGGAPTAAFFAAALGLALLRAGRLSVRVVRRGFPGSRRTPG